MSAPTFWHGAESVEDYLIGRRRGLGWPPHKPQHLTYRQMLTMAENDLAQRRQRVAQGEEVVMALRNLLPYDR